MFCLHRTTLMTVVKGERRASAALRLCGRSPSLDGLHGDGMGLETTVDQARIRGLATALPSFVRGHPRLGSGVRRGALPHSGAREFPPWPHPVSVRPVT